MRYVSHFKYGPAILCVFFLLPSAVFASLQITEVMYDVSGTDTGREWIEVKNNGPEPIDLSSWKLFEANVNHKITAIGTTQLQMGDFAVIADSPDKFRADNPNYTGLLFDSAFSLTNEGETFIVRDSSGVDIDSLAYAPDWGAAGDGNSLQRSSAGMWISATPTAGSATVATQSTLPAVIEEQKTTQNSPTASTIAGSHDTVTSVHASQEAANLLPDESDLEVTSGRSRLGFVGSALPFEAKVKAPKEISAADTIENVWSMGDGTSFHGDSIYHTYAFPGDYVVILNSRYKKTRAVSRVSVKIVEPHVFIAKAFASSVVLSNPDSFEVNLGGYSLMSKSLGDKWRSVIAEDTIIAPHSKLTVPYLNQKLRLGKDVHLINPSNLEVSAASITDKLFVTVPLGMTVESIRNNLLDSQK